MGTSNSFTPGAWISLKDHQMLHTKKLAKEQLRASTQIIGQATSTWPFKDMGTATAASYGGGTYYPSPYGGGGGNTYDGGGEVVKPDPLQAAIDREVERIKL